MKLDDHDANARDDRVGGSHVVCPNHRGVPNRGGDCGDVERVWRPIDQTYKVNGWSASDESGKDGKLVGCMMSGTTPKAIRTGMGDEECDEENPAMVCNMIGQSWGASHFQS